MSCVSHADDLAMSKLIADTTNAPPASNGHPVIRKVDVPVTALAHSELPTTHCSPPILHLHLLSCLYLTVTVAPAHFVVALLGSTVLLLAATSDLSPMMIILIWTLRGMKLPMQIPRALLDLTTEVLIKVIPGVFTIHWG